MNGILTAGRFGAVVYTRGMGGTRDRPIGADAAALERLRGHRVFSDRGRGVGPELESFLKGLKKINAQAARVGEAWETAAPDAVRAGTRVADLRAGVLVVEARSASDRHLADRWLRSGGLGELRALSRSPVTRVKFVLSGVGW